MHIARFVSRSSSIFRASVSSITTVSEGEILRMEHTFKHNDVTMFASVSGDLNPIHTDEASAVAAGFKTCVVHGMLCAGLFPSLIKSRIPGARFESKTLRFKEPALVGDCLEAEAKVMTVDPVEDSGISIEFGMECFKKEGRILVIEGKSKVFVPPF